MIEQGGLQVLIKAGSDGHELRTLPNGKFARRSEFVEVSDGVPVCVSIKILSSFSWSDATALSVQVKLGTATALPSHRISKPAEPSDFTVELENWILWSSYRKTWVAASFQFRNLVVSDLGVVNPHQKN